MIEISAVGGYNEVGMNMTAVRIDDSVIVLDMGLHIGRCIECKGDSELYNHSVGELTGIGAIPDISFIRDWQERVRLIAASHAHLDHIGAIPLLAGNYNAGIIATPYTVSVLDSILKDNKLKMRNRCKPLNPNSVYNSGKLSVEFIHMTHSVPQTVAVAIHTNAGAIIYTNDFKMDMSPVLGRKPNLRRLEQLGKKGVLCLIADSTRADEERKTLSESVAKQMLKDVLLGTVNSGLIVVTTFSSHLARLKSIIEIGTHTKRKVILMGRSLGRYINAGEELNLVDFSSKAEIYRYARQIKRILMTIKDDERSKYMLVVTGHQAEPDSVLSKILDDVFDFELKKDDTVVFSCNVIPNDVNIMGREKMEAKLKRKGVRIFRDIHVSGHAAKEDLRDLIRITMPRYIIPSHGDIGKRKAVAELATEMGYPKRNVILLDNGGRCRLA